MSLQDDYYDLASSLKRKDLEKLERIWEAFCEMEKEYEDLCRLRNSFRTMCELTFLRELYNALDTTKANPSTTVLDIKKC